MLLITATGINCLLEHFIKVWVFVRLKKWKAHILAMSWEDGGHKVTLGSWECHVCGDLVFLSLDVCRKRLFLLIKIIELCVNDQRIHKVCRFDHCQMFTSKLSYFEGFLYDDNPKAWQEIGQPVGWGALPLSIFYDLQIETKVSLSLRNFVVALSVCVCVCVLSSTQVLQR